MSSEVTTLEPELIAWLIGPETGRVDAWAPEPPPAELRCHPELVARLTEITKPVADVSRTFVAGCPVVHRRGGSPIAAACGTSWLAIRSGRPAGDLARRHPRRLPDDWVELEPWPVDIAFARGLDLLRGHVVRAQARAGAGI